MNICVFGAASDKIDKKYIEKVELLGEILAKRGHNLVFGAGGSGLMGAAARGAYRGGAEIYGVIPRFFREEGVEIIFDKCTELIFTDTMRERKAKMEELSDAFLVVPGGIGTYEEFFEILTLKQLKQHKKPIAVYNFEGYYNDIDVSMKNAIEKKFIADNCLSLYHFSENMEDIFDYIENDDIPDYDIKELKL